MPAAAITFRCYQCQKLLGASRSRIGSVVNCPKCSAELVVPEPEAPATEDSPSPEPSPSQSAIDVDDGFPAGLIQTEPRPAPDQSSASFFPDLRTQTVGQPFPFIQTEESTAPPPAVDRRKPKRPRPPSPEPSSSESFFPDPALFPAPSLTDETAAATLEYTRPVPPSRTPPPEVAPSVMAWPSATPSSQPIVPAVTTEPVPLRESPSRPRLGDRDESPRRNDVSIPRTVVVLWSFFVLLALMSAFVAGLTVGHFVWK
jgi:hypothetical protein